MSKRQKIFISILCGVTFFNIWILKFIDNFKCNQFKENINTSSIFHLIYIIYNYIQLQNNNIIKISDNVNVVYNVYGFIFLSFIDYDYNDVCLYKYNKLPLYIYLIQIIYWISKLVINLFYFICTNYLNKLPNICRVLFIKAIKYEIFPYEHIYYLKVKSRRKKKTCELCMEKKINTMYLNCNHARACFTCTKKIRLNNDNLLCPWCRQIIYIVEYT